jgi:hypothetical protein
MNDQQHPKPRGRPKRAESPGEVDIHARINGSLLEANRKPNCSLSQTINRALRIALEKDHPDDLKGLGIRIRQLKSEMSRINRELSAAREKAKALGVKNIREFEDSLAGWE